MKLPDFLNFEPLNDLRQRMGGAKLGEIPPVRLGDRLTSEELGQLSKQGIDVTSDQIGFLSDGTLAYKGRRVLVYIRDVAEYSNDQNGLPKFHIAHCRTLDYMLSCGKFDRYVVATRTDGIFNLNRKRVWASKFTPIECKLDVCRNCLGHLNWEGFRFQYGANERDAAVAAFSIAAFFLQYGTSIFKVTPKFSDQDAPLNEYSADFPALSNRVREEHNWTCESCGINLSGNGERQYLHVHHKNGVKSDNAPSNLMVLCFGCHALQPGHSHMQNSPGFRKFVSSHPIRWPRGGDGALFDNSGAA